MSRNRRIIIFSLIMLAMLATAAAADITYIMQRGGSRIRIDENGLIRVEPKSGGSTVVNGTVNFTSATVTGLPASAIPNLDASKITTGVFNASFIPSNRCQDTGANDSYACSISPAITSYVTGQVIWFKANTANTGAATLNLNSLGAKTIKKQRDVDLATNDIKAGQWVEVEYDGVNFQMLSQVSNGE